MVICQNQYVSWKFSWLWKLLLSPGRSFLGSLVGSVSPGSTWWAAQLWVKSRSSQALLHCRVRGRSGGPRKSGTEGFLCSTPQEQPRGCCGASSDTTALQTWQPSEKTAPPRWAYVCCIWFQKKWKTMFWASQNKIFSEFHYHRKGKTFLGFVPIQNKNCLEMSGYPTERKCQVLTHTSLKSLFEKNFFLI